MKPSTVLVLLYLYLYQWEALIIALLVLLPIGLAAYGIYRLLIWKMNFKVKKIFHTCLKITGIFIFVLFYAELTLTLITEHHVNTQLGFCYTTPETPEGEPFLIYEVVPGKTMDKAGFKAGDQIQMHATSDLYRLLINNQGKEIFIQILRNQKKIDIKVSVPHLDVPLREVSFLF